MGSLEKEVNCPKEVRQVGMHATLHCPTLSCTCLFLWEDMKPLDKDVNVRRIDLGKYCQQILGANITTQPQAQGD